MGQHVINEAFQTMECWSKWQNNNDCDVFSCIFVREESDAQESLVEAYRLLKSTAYQLYHVMQQNHVLQDLVTFFASRGVSQGAIYLFYWDLVTYISHMYGICLISTNGTLFCIIIVI